MFYQDLLSFHYSCSTILRSWRHKGKCGMVPSVQGVLKIKSVQYYAIRVMQVVCQEV